MIGGVATMLRKRPLVVLHAKSIEEAFRKLLRELDAGTIRDIFEDVIAHETLEEWAEGWFRPID